MEVWDKMLASLAYRVTGILENATELASGVSTLIMAYLFSFLFFFLSSPKDIFYCFKREKKGGREGGGRERKIERQRETSV